MCSVVVVTVIQYTGGSSKLVIYLAGASEVCGVSDVVSGVSDRRLWCVRCREFLLTEEFKRGGP